MISAKARKNLIDALAKLGGGALAHVRNVQLCSVRLSAGAEASTAERYIVEAYEALLEVNREISSRHRDGCACAPCRAKVM